MDLLITDVTEMAAALGRILDDPALRDHLGRRALRRAGGFTWDATARALLDCFHEFDTGRTWRISA